MYYVLIYCRRTQISCEIKVLNINNCNMHMYLLIDEWHNYSAN